MSTADAELFRRESDQRKASLREQRWDEFDDYTAGVIEKFLLGGHDIDDEDPLLVIDWLPQMEQVLRIQ